MIASKIACWTDPFIRDQNFFDAVMPNKNWQICEVAEGVAHLLRLPRFGFAVCRKSTPIFTR